MSTHLSHTHTRQWNCNCCKMLLSSSEAHHCHSGAFLTLANNERMHVRTRRLMPNSDDSPEKDGWLVFVSIAHRWALPRH